MVVTYEANGETIRSTSLTERLPNNHLLTTNRDRLGNTLNTVEQQRFDDGTALQTTTYPGGRTEVIATDTSGRPSSRTDTFPGLGITETVNTYTYDAQGRPVQQDSRTVQRFDDGTRLEEVTTVSGGGTATLRNTYGENGELLSSQAVQALAVSTLTDGQVASVLNDIAGVIGSIQGGKPLPILNSGLRLVNSFTANQPVSELVTTGQIVGGLASLYNLSNAFKNGDALTKVNATLSTLNYVNATLPSLINGTATAPLSAGLNSLLNGSTGQVTNAAGNLVSGQGLAFNAAPGVLPVIGLVLSIKSGDPIGIVSSLIGIINPALLTTPVGWILAGLSVLKALTDKTPEAWGSAKVVFDENGQFKLDSVGEGSGPERVSSQLQGTLDVLNAMLAQAQASSPNNPLGIVPQRMPSIVWREARQDDKGYAITDIDPVTGAQRYPYLRWDDKGTPFSSRPDLWQPDPTDPYVRASFNQQLVVSALQREAVAPQWEVDTARIQQQVGDPNAGLSETERAARMGLGASYDSQGKPAGQFRAVTLDLDGDGQIGTVAKDAAGNDVGFDWDDSGYQKQVAWLKPSDGFLFVDRNLNGVVDGGKELFSNSRVSDDYKGVRSLDAVDADRDGKITSADPVFKELKVWQDLNGDGNNFNVLADGSLTLDPGELKSLRELGITELDYVNGRLTRDGNYLALRSQQLEADADGRRVEAVANGIVINYSEGRQQFIINRVTSLVRNPDPSVGGGGSGGSGDSSGNGGGGSGGAGAGLVGGADRVDGVFEDGDPFGAARSTPQEIAIPVSLLLANDATDPATLASLLMTDVFDAVHGTVRLGDLGGQPAVFFTPEANYHSGMSGDASFAYVVRDGGGSTRTVQVQIPLQSVNDAPTVSVQLDQKSIYGYGMLITSRTTGNRDDRKTVVTYTTQQGMPFDVPYRTVMAHPQTGTRSTGWGQNRQVFPVFGNLVDTGIPEAILRKNFEDVPSELTVDGLLYQIPSGFSTVLHDVPIELKAWNDGVVSAVDVDGQANFSYEIVKQGLYGSTSIDASGRFAYTGRQYASYNEDGVYIGHQNVVTDYAIRSSETFNDVFTVRVHDGSGGYIDQDVAVPHFGARPLPDVEKGGGKPIAIDLDGDGFEFIDVNDSNVFVDVNGDGWRRRTAWVGADDGLLAFDENGNGVIDSGLEFSFSRFVRGAQTDLEGLRAFDTNNDGVFTAADAQWSKFGVWQDANSNGITDAGEFKRLDEIGISGIGLTSDGQFRVINGQTVHGVGRVAKTDGNTLAMADVTLRYSQEARLDGDQTVALQGRQTGQTFWGSGDKDLVFGTAGSDNIATGDAADAIVDDAGDDIIDAGAGDDLIFSGMGNDVVLAGAGDDAVFTGEGNDVVFGDDENGQGNDLIMLAGGNDVAFGGGGHDFIGGGAGNDILSGDAGDDKLFGEDGWDVLMGGTGNDELWGMAGNDYLDGGDGSDLLAGGAGDDVMQGGAGDDIYEVDSLGDVVDETIGGTLQGQPGHGDAGGVDTVRASIDYRLGGLLENLTLAGEALQATGNAKNNVLIGNAANNTLVGLEGNDVLDGAGGADTLIGGMGDDTYVIDNAGDHVVEAAGEGIDTVRSRISTALADNVENLTLIGPDAINATGNGLDNRLVGNTAANVLDGGAGADQMFGGRGDDVYIVDNQGDVVHEQAGEGTDAVRSFIDYTLTDNVEALELLGNAVVGVGNALANRIHGNARDNQIDGGAGADFMAGGQGNDIYRVDSHGDVVSEEAGQGIDAVMSAINYTLTAHVDNLQLTGSATTGVGNGLDNRLVANDLGNDLDGLDGNDVLVGGAGTDRLSGGVGDDTLLGNGGNDLLDGEAGADLMRGGRGDDVYIVDNLGDVVHEQEAEGTDAVRSSIDYALTENVEDLELTGHAVKGVGNALANRIHGNARDNQIDGGAGADFMAGGQGNDIYRVDSHGDVVSEEAGQGIDTVMSAINYTLTAHVENLQLTGTATTAAGNGLDNRLVANDLGNDLEGLDGNDVLVGGAGTDRLSGGVGDDTLLGNGGNDLLDGGTGADLMRGGRGNDRYVVDNAGDVVDEAEGGLSGGVDTVTSSVDYTLTRDVENLILVGDANVGVGNELNNEINGNDQGNTLSGLAGDDRLMAGGGDDILLGGAGQDELFGNAGADLLDGGLGADRMFGGRGDDVYIVDNLGDVVHEQEAEGTDAVRSSIDYALTENVEDLELTGNAVKGVGNGLANRIHGNALGNDIDGGAGADFMAGRQGNDLYRVDSVGDVIFEAEGEGVDQVFAIVNYTLSDNVENLGLGGLATRGIGNGLSNTIEANALSSSLYGLGGNDLLLGGAGDDALVGGDGDDTLDGKSGADWMSGGQGDDLFMVDSAGDGVYEEASQGIDTVTSVLDYTLTANVENLQLAGTATVGTGNELDNRLVANGLGNLLRGLDGHDLLMGGAGDDQLLGGAGEDTLWGSDGHDLLDGGAGSDLMQGGRGDDHYLVDNERDLVEEVDGGASGGVDVVTSSIDYTVTRHVENLTLVGHATVGVGNELNNKLIGNDLGNRLSGLDGDDWLIAGGGDDVLLGGAGQDALFGNAGVDLLDGGAGDDLMVGGQGADEYRVDSAGDQVVEQNEQGLDKVVAAVNYRLTSNVEDLFLIEAATVGIGNELNNLIHANIVSSSLHGLGGDDTLLGAMGDDLLDGGSGDDQLDGSVGADTMLGGSGNDGYRVDQAGDRVVELAAEGYDTVTSKINYVLPEHVEKLILVGSATHGTGNELNNTLVANALGNVLDGMAGDDLLLGGSGNDVLDGGTGADEMRGGMGHDSYVVDDTLDLAIESADHGYDQVSSSINYVLPQHIEKLILTGFAISGTGNVLSNHLVGNGMANILDGAGGVDFMEGGAGDDRYVVDDTGDIVHELTGNGNDTVLASVDFALSSQVENLVLTAGAGVATGNEMDNVLVGNALANVLHGEAGNDVLAGWLGDDRLFGGAGDDAYLWNQGDGRDTISDTSGLDAVRFGAGISLDSLAAREYTVDGVRRVFISVLDADGEERADQGIDFALDTATVTKTTYDHWGRPNGTVTETIYSSPNESFLLADGTLLTLDQLKPPLVHTDGSWGNDTLTGSRADDRIDGWSGGDTLYGRSGYDTLNGGAGRDLLFGEGGHDRLSGGANDDYLQGGTGNDLLEGDQGCDVLLGGAGNDKLSGGADADVLDAGRGNDVLNGDDGEDELWAGAGDDELSGGNDSDLLAGGVGNDVLDGGLGVDVIVAGAGQDRILGGHGNDFIDAGAGNDQIDAEDGNDFIVAGKGNDTLHAGSGSNVVAFNQGDGADVWVQDHWQQDAVSLGGGIGFADLTLSRQGDNLVLGMGQGDQITLQGWYAGSLGYGKGVSRLQIVNAAVGGDFNAASHDRMVNREVVVFDFREFVASFDRHAQSDANGAWSAESALRFAYLYGSHSQAIGGDLAFGYAALNSEQKVTTTYSARDWKEARNEMFGMGNYMQILHKQPADTVTAWAAMQAGTSLIVEMPTGASLPIDIRPALTQDEIVVQAMTTQQQLSGQSRPSWV